MVYVKKDDKDKISPQEKRIGEYTLKRGEMAMGCHLYPHLNVFTMDSLRSMGVLKKDLRLTSCNFIDNLWDEVPAAFKQVKAFKSLRSHYKKKHPGQDFPPVLLKGTKEMKEKKRAREAPKMVWTNTMGHVRKETALRRSKRIRDKRGS